MYHHQLLEMEAEGITEVMEYPEAADTQADLDIPEDLDTPGDLDSPEDLDTPEDLYILEDLDPTETTGTPEATRTLQVLTRAT